MASASAAGAQSFRVGRAPGFRAGFQFLGGSTPAAVFTMTQLAKSSRIYQRDTMAGGGQGYGQGVVPVTINVTSAGRLFARRRSIDGSNTILQAAWLASSSVATGTQTLNVTGVDVPALSDPDTASQTNDGYFYLDLSGDGASWTQGTTPISMGDLIATGTSQSLVFRLFQMVTDTTALTATTGYAVGTGTATKGNLVISPFCRAFVNLGNNGAWDFTGPSAMAWQLPVSGTATAGSTTAEYNSAGMVALSRLLIKQRKCPIGFIGAASGQTDSAYWSGSGAGVTMLNSMLSACDNKWSGEYLTGLGHTDSLEQTAAATFASNWTSGVNAAQALNTLTSRTQYVYAFTIPFVTSKYGYSYQTDNAIRQIGVSTAAAQGWKYLSMPDLTLSDGVHPNQAGAVRMALHYYRAMRPTWVSGAGDHKGPSIASVTRAASVGGTMTVNLNMNGATSIGIVSGGSLATFGNFRMGLLGSGSYNLAGTSTPYLLSAGDIYTYQTPGTPGTTLTFVDTLPDQPIDIWLGSNFTTTQQDGAANYLFDNRIESDESALGIDIGRPLEPNVSAFTAAANGNLTYNLSYTGTPTYSASSSGFGTALDVARGQVNFGITPARTLLARVKAGTTAPTALEAIAQAGADWFGINTDGSLRVSVGGAVLNSAGGASGFTGLTDGNWHEIELCIAGGVLSSGANNNGSYYLYLDGTRIATGSIGNKTANSGSIYARAINGANLPTTGRLVDSLAVFSGVRNTGTTKTVLSAPLVGNEANLRALYNFESNGNDSCTN